MTHKTIKQFRGEHSFLSNFYAVPIFLDGILYPSAEHCFQACKTLDPVQKEVISKIKSPVTAKRMGRKLKLREDWEEVKILIMENIIAIKFCSTEELKQKLLNTNNLHLEEGNNWGDRFWGTVNGSGNNHLGKIIMTVRERIRQDDYNS